MSQTNRPPSDYTQELKDRFDYTMIFGMGFLKGKSAEEIISELMGVHFKVQVGRLYVEGLDERTFRIHTPNGHIDRPFMAEEKLWLIQHVNQAIQLYLTKTEVTELKSKLLKAEVEIATLKASK